MTNIRAGWLGAVLLFALLALVAPFVPYARIIVPLLVGLLVFFLSFLAEREGWPHLLAPRLGSGGRKAAEQRGDGSFHVVDRTLPSASPGISFVLSCVVTWEHVSRSDAETVDPRLIAEDLFLRHCEEKSGVRRLDDVHILETLLASTLADGISDPAGRVSVTAQDLRLSARMADPELREALAARERDLRLRDLERAYDRKIELDQCRHVEKVFATPRSALLWWIANNPSKIAEAGRLYGSLTAVSQAIMGVSDVNGAAPGEDRDNGAWLRQVRFVIDGVCPPGLDNGRSRFVKAFAVLLEHVGRADLAAPFAAEFVGEREADGPVDH